MMNKILAQRVNGMSSVNPYQKISLKETNIICMQTGVNVTDIILC